MTSSGGQVAWQARYKVWGALLQETDGPYRNPSPEGKDYRPLPQNLRFQGQYFDAETGLHYNTFRYYDPDVGRFTTEDPIGLNGGLNLYQYAPNPFAWIDPWGLEVYELVARSDGWYPVHEYGKSKPIGEVFLREGDKWKIGESKRPEKRYTRRYLDSIGVGKNGKPTGVKMQIIHTSKK